MIGLSTSLAYVLVLILMIGLIVSRNLRKKILKFDVFGSIGALLVQKRVQDLPPDFFFEF